MQSLFANNDNIPAQNTQLETPSHLKHKIKIAITL